MHQDENNKSNIEAVNLASTLQENKYTKFLKYYPLFIILIGILQGIVLYKISDITIINKTDVIYVYLLAITFPLCLYLSYVNSLSILKQLVYSLIITGISLFAYFIADIKINNQPHYHLSSYYDDNTDVIANFINFYICLIIIGFPLFLGVKLEKFKLKYDYKLLFSISWQNIFILFVGFFITLISGSLIYLSAYLFKIINIGIFIDLLQKTSIFIPLICGLFSLSINILKQKVNYIQNIRKYWLAINALFFYFIAIASIVWLASTPFTGLDTLFNTKKATSILVIYIIFYIKFMNCVYEDGDGTLEYAKHKILKYVPYAVLVLIGLFSIACLALYIRTDKYGLTMSRINAWIVLSIVGIYVFGYAISCLKPKVWMSSLPKTNVISAITTLIIGFILISPLVNFNHIIIKNQVEKLLNGSIKVDDFDFYHLKRLGVEGSNELKNLANLRNHKLHEEINQKAQTVISNSTNANYNQPSEEKDDLDDSLKIKQLISEMPKYVYDKTTSSSKLIKAGQDKSFVLANEKIQSYLKHSMKECVNNNHKKGDCILWLANLNAENDKDEQIFLVSNNQICGFNLSSVENVSSHVNCDLTLYNNNLKDKIINNKITIKPQKYFSLENIDTKQKYNFSE